MWQKKQWPYKELKEGDTLYWYESPSQSVVWRTVVSEVERLEYEDKELVWHFLQERFGEFDTAQSYYLSAPSKGYCLAYKVLPLEKVNYEKPENFSFPYLGWLKLSDELATTFFGGKTSAQAAILDDFAPAGDLAAKLHQLNAAMANVQPQKIRAIVSQTIRRDTELVRSLKRFYNFTCQFPGCGVRIPKLKGGWYIEVAHIQPVAKGGRSVLGNLLVLCPNHHKEFDYGKLEIEEQTNEVVRGRLNGKEFAIKSKLI